MSSAAPLELGEPLVVMAYRHDPAAGRVTQVKRVPESTNRSRPQNLLIPVTAYLCDVFERMRRAILD